MAKKPKSEQNRPQDIASKAQPFIERMDYLDREMQEKREEIAEARKIIVEDAETMGITKKAFMRILRLRKLDEAKAALTEKLDIDEASQFAALAEAFGDSPFGRFARGAAEALEQTLSGLKADAADDIDQLAG